jgi:hypothetical protein
MCWATVIFQFSTYIHSIVLNRALASLAGFLIVRYIRCGVISPTIYLVLAIWYDHQGHLLAKPADTWWQSRLNAGEKRGRWILPTSICLARSVLLHAINLWHGTDGFPSEGRGAADCITLKILRPWPGLNPRTLGPVASTLTTRPPRVTSFHHKSKILSTFIFMLYLFEHKNDCITSMIYWSYRHTYFLNSALNNISVAVTSDASLELMKTEVKSIRY